MARILVIDDNPDMLDMLRMILQGRGQHDVMLSADGQDGLTKALSEHPDVAIVDVMMPGMNGYDVVRRIRANPGTAKMKIVILTARGQPVDKMAAEQAGADLHLSKPVRVEVLLDTIEQLLGPGKRGTAALVIPVLSLRGGMGRTTVAVNLALLLQQVGATTLIDLSPNSGHCALYAGMKPSNTWETLLKRENFTEEDNMLRACLSKHGSGMQLLAAPELPVLGKGFSQEQVAGLLQALSAGQRFLVVDMPPMLDHAAQAALEAAYRIVLISGDDPPGIQTTLRTLQILAAQQQKMLLALNKVAPGPRPPTDALQRALRCPITAQLPYDATQVTVLRRGAPLVLSAPQSPLVLAIQEIAKQIIA